MFTFIHAADFHLDSPFGALPASQAAARRRESRELIRRLSDYVREHRIDAVLLAGDLFDSAAVYRETGEELAEALGRMPACVLISPGNHDWYGPDSPWTRISWPDNVVIFREDHMTAVEVPAWNAVFHGAAFTGPERSTGFLRGFTAPRDGRIHIGILHGEPETGAPRYAPVSRAEIAASGLHYLALGHVHKRSEPARCGGTLYAWSGCPEGRGFDELGEKGFYQGTVTDDGQVTVRFVPFARHRYHQLTVDVTGQDPREAIRKALPELWEEDLYRILLTGETDERGINEPALREELERSCYALELRDHTVMGEALWKRAGEDSLRGLFLRQLLEQRERASTAEEQELVDRAARFGLAALAYRDLG